MCHFFTKPPLTAPGDCHWKGAEAFLEKAENTTCLIQFFSNWYMYSDLYQFHPLWIFRRLKLRRQSIRFCAASHLHGTLMRNLHFCVIFVHRYLFSKWCHCTSFKLDLLFVSYELYLLRFYCQIFSRWIMWDFSNTASCVYWIIYEDYSFRETKRLKSQNYAAKRF